MKSKCPHVTFYGDSNVLTGRLDLLVVSGCQFQCVYIVAEITDIHIRVAERGWFFVPPRVIA